MVKSGVYLIRNTRNLKCYIGSSNNLQKRWYGHKKSLREGTHYAKLLQEEWNIYGEDSFLFEVLEEVEPIPEKLLYNEQTCMWLFKPLYNARHTVQMSVINENGKKNLSNRMTLLNKSKAWKPLSNDSLKRKVLTRMKLTEKQVYEIANLYQQNISTIRQLACDFNVSEDAIGRLVNNKISIFPNLIPIEFERTPTQRRSLSGLNNVNCRFTEDQIREIRKLRNVDNKPLKEIALKFNTTTGVISGIATYKSWKYFK